MCRLKRGYISVAPSALSPATNGRQTAPAVGRLRERVATTAKTSSDRNRFLPWPRRVFTKFAILCLGKNYPAGRYSLEQVVSARLI